MIYLDNAATTPVAPEVLEAMLPYFEGEFGNASSVYQLGSRARVALENAREIIAGAIHALPKEIVFTSGGTEANNAAIKGTLFSAYNDDPKWNRLSIVTSTAEHHAVLGPVEWLSKFGVEAHHVPLSPHGHALVDAEQIPKETTLVSLMMVNNETGAINPTKELSGSVRSRSEAYFHTDAVQALGKIPIDVQDLGIDLLSLSAHKIHGPKGIGALYVRSGIAWEPFIHGGSQERNRRGGTEAVALAVGFARAIQMLPNLNWAEALRKHLLEQLAAIPEIVQNSASDTTSIDSIVNFSFVPSVLSKLDPDALLIRYDLEGIAVSNGSACTSGSQQPSHVLIACGRSPEVAMKSIRVSFSRYTTLGEIDSFISATKKILGSLR